MGGEIPGSHLSSGGMAALLTAQPLGLETCLCLGECGLIQKIQEIHFSNQT